MEFNGSEVSLLLSKKYKSMFEYRGKTTGSKFRPVKLTIKP
jgi:hypothetical protein